MNEMCSAHPKPLIMSIHRSMEPFLKLAQLIPFSVSFTQATFWFWTTWVTYSIRRCKFKSGNWSKEFWFSSRIVFANWRKNCVKSKWANTSTSTTHWSVHTWPRKTLFSLDRTIFRWKDQTSITKSLTSTWIGLNILTLEWAWVLRIRWTVWNRKQVRIKLSNSLGDCWWIVVNIVCFVISEIEQTFLGMLENYNRPLELMQFIENGRERKRSQVEAFVSEFERTVVDTKANILKKRAQSIKDDISDFIRNWFREMSDDYSNKFDSVV